MKNKFYNFRCRKCISTTSKWTKLPSTEIHSYRVTCRLCDCFVGWGNEQQLQQLLSARQPIETAVAVVEPPAATLEDYF